MHVISLSTRSAGVSPAPKSTTHFRYDALHRRVARLDHEGTLTRFVRDGWNVITEEREKGQEKRSFTLGATTSAANRKAQAASEGCSNPPQAPHQVQVLSLPILRLVSSTTTAVATQPASRAGGDPYSATTNCDEPTDGNG
jgi:YD repeat-containing protein